MSPPAMPIAYRSIRREDEAAVLDLWAEALDENREELAREWRARGRERLEHTQVAVAPEGTLMAASTFTLGVARDSDGSRRQVGRLQYFATRATARGRGYGSRLLDETVAALRRAGCLWTLTWTSPAVAGFYARRGWRAFALPVCEGEPVMDLPRHPSSYVIRRYDPTLEPGCWSSLAAVYAEDSARRPLTAVRDAAYWRAHIAARLLGQRPWLRPPGIVLVAARSADPNDLCGYVIVHFWHVHEDNDACTFEVSELCTRPDDDEAAEALLRAVAVQAAAHDCPMRRGRLFVPREPRSEAVAGLLFRDPEWSDFTTVLVCPIAPELDAAWLEALLAAPGAICWSLDIL